MRLFWSSSSCLLHAILLVLILSIDSSSSLNSAPITTSPPHKTDDKVALLAFKHLITKDPKGALNSWNDSLHFCEWLGVTCSRRHRERVTLLQLEEKELEGTLSPEIGKLSFLKSIKLIHNKFSGVIPASLSNASRLESIDLSYNQFTGSVPSDLGKLHYLREISLSSNKLGTNLGDDLSFIDSLTNCSKLELLDISHNHLKGPLPHFIANLSTQLKYLSIGENQIYGNIPIGIENLVNLQWLEAWYNNLTGSIPTGIGKLNNLKKLDLSQNKISGPIPSLANCPNLIRLDLSNNNLNGTACKEVMNLPTIMYLNLSRNALSGSLPFEVINLRYLSILDVSHNRFGGYIPDLQRYHLSMNYLNMAGNLFVGKIPQSLSVLKGITYLDLSSNKLSGKIPELWNSSLLTYLNLSYNDLDGPVPTNGVFADANAISVAGNNKLCGGVYKLKLNPCYIMKKGKSLPLKVIIPVIVVTLFSIILLCFSIMLHQRRKLQKKPSAPSVLNHQYPRISYAELLDATNGFSADTLIGAGRHGNVYKGFLEQSETIVAVKVLNLQEQGASKSFLAECNALRNIRHRNLVKIVTCCSSMDFQGNDFKALVYEFIPNGSLEEWLHHRRAQWHELRSLNFLQRLNIAIDVASALDYLQHHCQPAVIHCDLKPSNILLDREMTAYVSDFGLAKNFSATSYGSAQSIASSSIVNGSIGYIAPEYGMGGLVSIKGDVYSYGILLLEMFTGKRPTDDMFQDGQNLHSFAKMALPKQVMNIVDPAIPLLNSGRSNNSINRNDGHVRIQDCVVSVIKLGVKCSAESPMKRLNMGEVVCELYHIKEYYQGVRIGIE